MQDILCLIAASRAKFSLATSPRDQIDRRASLAASALMARPMPMAPKAGDGKPWTLIGWATGTGNVSFPFTGGDRASYEAACRELARWCVESPNRYAALRAFAEHFKPKEGKDGRTGEAVLSREGEHAHGVTCFGFDADVGGKAQGHKAAGFETPEACRKFIEALSRDYLKPSLVVDTGGGLQFFFNLDRCAEKGELGDSHLRANALAPRLMAAMQVLAAMHGGKLDPTADAPRVLRLPGCWRKKDAGRNGEVLAGECGDSHSLEALEALCAKLEALPAARLDFEFEAGGLPPQYRGGDAAVAPAQRHPKRRAAPRSASQVWTKESAEQQLARSAAARPIIREMASLLSSRFEEAVAHGSFPVFIFDTCPACLGEESAGTTARQTARLTHSGRLKCWRATCPANQGGEGLEASDWILAHAPAHARQRLAGLAIDLREAQDSADAIADLSRKKAEEEARRRAQEDHANRAASLEAAQSSATAAIRRAANLDPSAPMPGIGVVRVPTGVGKTYAAVRLAIDGGGAPGELCLAFQTHDLLRQAIKDLEASGVPVVVLEGIGTACKFKDRYRELGQPADWRRRVCVDCPVRSSCGAMRKPKAGHLLACVVAHLPHLVDGDGDDDPSPLRGRRLIIDEAPATVEGTQHAAADLKRTERNLGRFGRDAVAARLAVDFLRGILDGCVVKSRAAPAEVRAHGVPVHGDDLLAIARDVESRLDAETAKAAADAPPQGTRWTIDRRRIDPDAADGFLPRIDDLDAPLAIEVEGEEAPTTMRAALRDLLRSAAGGLVGSLSGKKLRATEAANGYAPEDLPHPDFLRVLRAVLAAAGDPRRAGVEVVVRDDADGRVDAWFEVRRTLNLSRIRAAVDGLAILDATADQSIAELRAVSPGIAIEVLPVQFEVPDPQRFWRRRKDATRRKLCAGAATDLSVDAWSIIRATVRDAVEAFGGVRPGERLDIGLLSFRQVVGAIERAIEAGVLRDRLDLPEGVDLVLGYFGRDDRGSRRFEGVGGMVVLGTPTPNLRSCEADARALGFDAGGAAKLIEDRTMRAVVQAVGRPREARRPVPIMYSGAVLPANWGADTVQVVDANPGAPAGAVRTAVEAVVEDIIGRGLGATAEVVLDLLRDYSSQPLKENLYRGCEIYSPEAVGRAFERVARDLKVRKEVQFVAVPLGRGRPRRVLVAFGVSPDVADHVARRALYIGAEVARRDSGVVVPVQAVEKPVQPPVQPVASPPAAPAPADTAPPPAESPSAPQGLPFAPPSRFVDPGDQSRRRKAVASAWAPQRTTAPIIQSRPAIITRMVGGAA